MTADYERNKPSNSEKKKDRKFPKDDGQGL